MITFKRATSADAAELTAVQKRTFDDDSQRYLGTESGGPPGYDSLKWQLHIMKKSLYYKILCDGKIIGGMIIFRMGNGHYELGRIFIDPEYQNQGIGTQTIAFIEQTFPDAHKWTLGTPSWALRNHHFYEKLGYVRVGEEKQGGIEDMGFLYEKVIAHKGG
jgi:GNAT superfamily N-acetyltransferase